MEETQKEKTGHEDIITHVKDYLETSYKLFELQVAKKASKFASHVFLVIIIVVLGLLTIGLLSLTLASWLGDVFNDRTLGYLVTSGFLLVLLICFIAGFKKISLLLFRNRIIRKIYDKSD